MDVDFKLYFWLVKLNVFPRTALEYHPVISLPKEVAQKFTSGFILGQILNALKTIVHAEQNKNLDFTVLKDSFIDDEIRSNWRFILIVLEGGFKVKLDSKTKELIQEKDKTIICELVNILFEK